MAMPRLRASAFCCCVISALRMIAGVSTQSFYSSWGESDARMSPQRT
jgi:hypothetical protein